MMRELDEPTQTGGHYVTFELADDAWPTTTTAFTIDTDGPVHIGGHDDRPAAGAVDVDTPVCADLADLDVSGHRIRPGVTDQDGTRAVPHTRLEPQDPVDENAVSDARVDATTNVDRSSDMPIQVDRATQVS